MNSIPTVRVLSCAALVATIFATVFTTMFATQLLAQSAIAAGTILPVRLNSELNSHKANSGEVISARLMQDIHLPSGSTLHPGLKVVGRVINVERGKAANAAQLSIRFDALIVSGRRVPITTNVRAIASMMEVEDAQIPEFGPDRGTPENTWTTDQIGGEVVYRGGGPVANGLRSVGQPTPNGVLVQVSAKPGTKCRADVAGNDRPQALWLFSSDACGVYGFSDLTIVHAGRTNPVGEITLASEHGDVKIRAGSGILLRVISTTPDER
ncbi:MAG: hypothetical protein WBV55_20625 [Candidatus Sulfotelmatobacter sp.]